MSFFIFPNTNLQIGAPAPQRSRTCQVCLSFLLIRFLNKSKNSCFHLPRIIQQQWLVLPMEAVPTEMTPNSWHLKSLGSFHSTKHFIHPTLGEEKKAAWPVPCCPSFLLLAPEGPCTLSFVSRREQEGTVTFFLPHLLFPLCLIPSPPWVLFLHMILLI